MLHKKDTLKPKLLQPPIVSRDDIARIEDKGVHIMSEEKLSVEELKKKAEKPGKDAMILHPFYQGKIQSIGKVPVRDFSDFAIWYTPCLLYTSPSPRDRS